MTEPVPTPAAVAPADQWALRPWLTAALLAVDGLLVYAVSGPAGLDAAEPWRAALVAALIVGPLAFAFTFGRDRWREPLAFAVLAALVMAGLAWRTTAADGHYADPEFGFAAGLVAVLLALPLMQAGFHRTRWATPYSAIHAAAWTDALCAAGALAFTGAAWLLLLLLGQLFHLLRIDLIQDLMKADWFGWMFSGAAFGAALGLLRGEAAILGTLQRVVMVVLSILAVPLAAGLALFLVAMVISGPDVLWAATRNATPILLLCAAGCWLLANAIVRDRDGDASASRILRGAALVLVVIVLPLTVFGAISLGTRIAQHGLSPERIWGLIAIAVACVYGVAWLVAAVRGWRGGAWMGQVRRANVNLAVLVGVLALILALPIVDFGAISARSQVARLERGAVSAEDFDYTALRWDFGDAGRRALAGLTRSGNPAVARLAALAMRDRRATRAQSRRIDRDLITVRTGDPALAERVYRHLETDAYRCAQGCYAIDLGPAPEGQRFAIIGGAVASVVILGADGQSKIDVATGQRAQSVLYRHGDTVAVRAVRRNEVTVNGQPIEVIDPARALEGVTPDR